MPVPQVCILIIAIALTIEADAEEGAPPVRAVTLEEALREAESRQPTLIAIRARLAAAAADARVPRAGWLPRLGVTAQVLGGTTNNSTASFVSTPVLDLPRIGATTVGGTSWRPEPSTLVAVGLRQEIFDFGRIAAMSAVADALARVEEKRGAGQRFDVRLGVKEAYFAVGAAKGVLRASEGAFQRAQAHRDFARAAVTNGLRPAIEVTRSEADLMRFDVGRVRALGGLLVARAVLAAAVGAPEDELDAVGAEPLPAPARVLADAIARADALSPLIQEVAASEEAQAARTRALTAALLPDLQLTSTLSGRAGGSPPNSGPVPFGGGWLPSVPNWDVALVLAWPALDFGVLAQRAASEQQRVARAAEVQAARQRTRTQVQQAWQTVQLAQAMVPTLEKSLEAARANQAQAEARFRGGLGTSVELADAEALRTDAEIQIALGQFEWARAQARFSRVIAEDD